MGGGITEGVVATEGIREGMGAGTGGGMATAVVVTGVHFEGVFLRGNGGEERGYLTHRWEDADPDRIMGRLISEKGG